MFLTEKKSYNVVARGVFRKNKVNPLVGDYVVYQAENKTDGYVLEVKG